MPEEVSAGAVVFCMIDDTRKYLLLHHNNKSRHWGFPKGKIEGNEQPIDTARREIKEEAGISTLAFVDGFCETLHYYYVREERQISKQADFFLAQVNNDRVRLSDEHIGYAWLPFEAALKRLTHENRKEVLKKAEAFLNEQ